MEGDGPSPVGERDEKLKSPGLPVLEHPEHPFCLGPWDLGGVTEDERATRKSRMRASFAETRSRTGRLSCGWRRSHLGGHDFGKAWRAGLKDPKDGPGRLLDPILLLEKEAGKVQKVFKIY